MPVDSDLVDGTVITNSAEFEGNNTNLATDDADITVTVPRTVTPVATKTWTPDSAIAGSGAESTMTLGVRNASSSSAEVTALTLTDTDAETFERFDVTRVGPVVYPPGTNQVEITWLVGAGGCPATPSSAPTRTPTSSAAARPSRARRWRPGGSRTGTSFPARAS